MVDNNTLVLARPGQSLQDHLEQVACKAKIFAAPFQGGDEAWWAGMLHDLGKCRREFQEYLSGRREGGPDTHHAPYGATLAFQRYWFPAAFAIAGHHAGLHDLHQLQEMVEGRVYQATARLPPLEQWFTQHCAKLPEQTLSPSFLGNNPLALEHYSRMIFSCLVDADRLDAEQTGEGRAREVRRLADVLDVFIERVARERQGKSRDGQVNTLRHAVFDQCLTAAQWEPGFFSLTVPTGGGKTLSSMAFALAHAKRHRLDRIIVVIPYLSIIEQNAAEYRRILDPDDLGLVVEHHSSAEVRHGENGEDAGELSLAADNWDAPFIVTTSVQFVESLFAAAPGRCRKLHNIANSLVLFDEVQTLPAHLLNPLLNVLKELCRNYRTSFLFMTATQPAFRRGFSLSEGFASGELREIIQDASALFVALQRVEYHPPLEFDWPALAIHLAACSQALCVVNIRRHAVELWEVLRDAVPPEERDSVFHLSSSMCAAHRLAVLGDSQNPRLGSVRHRLRNNLPCRLVATQVVEAGVDIDFPVLYRALGPLDAIAQAAGRCNREGRLRDAQGQPILGRVHVFKPLDGGLPPGIYTTATGISAAMLGECLEFLGRTPEVFGRYFSQLFQMTVTGDNIQADRGMFRYREVARKARVIKDAGQPVVVLYRGVADDVQAIRERRRPAGEPRFDRLDLRRLQRGMVNVREGDFARLRHLGMITPLLPNLDLYVLHEGCYHEHLGLVLDNRPLEDFIQ